MARLPVGMRRTDKGLIQNRFTVNGKRISVYGKTPQECREKEAQRRHELETGLYRSGKDLTVAEYFERWYAGRVGTVKPNTLRLNMANFKRLKDIPIDRAGTTFGALKLAKIEPQNVRELQARLAEKYTTTGVNVSIKFVRSLFNAALAERLVTWNPAEGVKTLKRTEKEARDTTHRALSTEETKAFFECAAGEWYFNLFKLLINTGLRIGEAGALFPSDIDLQAGTIHVRRTLTRDELGGYMIGDNAKTSNGSRDIPLLPGAREAIIAQRELNRAIFGDSKKILRLHNQEPIFRSIGGGLLITPRVDEKIAAICRRSGVERFTAHAFRDTFATRAVESGMQAKTLQEILGHADIGITMNLYAHVMEQTKREQMAAITIAL